LGSAWCWVGSVWFGLDWLVGWLAGWLDGREEWDGGDVIVRMIFVILQERRRGFIGVPRAWLSCREECGKVKKRAGVCVRERTLFSNLQFDSEIY
jgi:hypothetical protein